MGRMCKADMVDRGIEVERFQEALEVVDRNRKRIGIGTQSERTVHAVLKHFYEPDEDHHEIPIGKFIADIYRDKRIIEVQTKQLFRLKDKLTCFLEQEHCQVTVVHPIVEEKWVIKLDETTGEQISRKKSPRKGKEYDAFPELYGIKGFLKHPGLHIKIVLIQAEEYRIPSDEGKYRRKGFERIDTVPISILKEIELHCANDYMQFIPYGLDEFTVLEFAKEAGISKYVAQYVIHILYHVGMITRIGKKANAYVYKVLDI